MDKVSVKGLRFHSKHGCHKEERLTGGTFVADVDITVNNSAAADSDSVEDAIDYVRVMEIAENIFFIPKNLIETVARDLAQALLDEFKTAMQVDVCIKKLSPPVSYDLEYVSVSTSLKRAANN